MAATESLRPHVVIVASEPLTRRPKDWHELPHHHVLSIGQDLGLELRPIEPVTTA